MNEGEIRQLAALEALITEREAVIARIKGMDALNQHRIYCGHSVAYNDGNFFEAEKDLQLIADKIRESV